MRVKRAARRRGALIELHPDRAMRRLASRPTVGRWASCAIAATSRSASGFSCARSCWRSATTSGSRTSRASGPTRSTARPFACRETFVLEDASGDEVARIQERKLTIRDKIAIERGGDTAATVHKALVGIRDRFAIDVEHGDDMKAHGNVVDHEYEIERDGDTVATISKKWFRVRGVLRRRRRGGRGHRAHPRDHRRHRRADQPGLNPGARTPGRPDRAQALSALSSSP